MKRKANEKAKYNKQAKRTKQKNKLLTQKRRGKY